MRHDRFSRALFVSFFLFSTGCLSYSTLHTATPVENIELTFAPTTLVVDNTLFVVPEAEIRANVSPNSDFGVRLFTGGVGTDYNFALVNNSSFALSLNPTVALGFAGGIYGSYALNVLIDIVKTDGITLTLAGEVGAIFESEHRLTFGGGALAKVRMSERVFVAPGLDYLYSTGGIGFPGGCVDLCTDPTDFAGVRFHLGFHFVF